MKGQRRHELQTNELADRLGRYVQAAKPYQNLIAGVLLVIVAGVGSILYFTGQARAKAARGWSDYFSAATTNDATALEEVAVMHGDTTASLWAQQAAGDVKLSLGSSTRLTNKDEAEKQLRDAIKIFQDVEAKAGDRKMLLQRARLGMATAYESLCELEKAKSQYEEAARVDPDSAIGQVAQQRVEELSRSAMRRWYAWFERQEFQPPTPPQQLDDELGLPDDLGTLPDGPEGTMPEVAPELKLEPATEESENVEGPLLDLPEGPTKSELPMLKRKTPAEAAEPEAKPEPPPIVDPLPADEE
jgi:hypothetical protein